MNGPLSLIVKAAVIFIIVGIAIHDVVAIAITRYVAKDIAQTVADAAATTWRSSVHDEDATVATAMSIAEQKGSKLVGFTAEEQKVSVKVKVDPRSTFVLRYIKSVDWDGDGEAIATTQVVW